MFFNNSNINRTWKLLFHYCQGVSKSDQGLSLFSEEISSGKTVTRWLLILYLSTSAIKNSHYASPFLNLSLYGIPSHSCSITRRGGRANKQIHFRIYNEIWRDNLFSELHTTLFCWVNKWILIRKPETNICSSVDIIARENASVFYAKYLILFRPSHDNIFYFSQAQLNIQKSLNHVQSHVRIFWKEVSLLDT